MSTAERTNMKVKCTGYNTTERKFLLNKIYEVKNGKITNETGYVYEYKTNEKVLEFLSHWYKFEEVKKECIVIYSKGNETIALNRSTGEKAVAKCSPEDTYDFNTGAKLAFERLIGEKPPMHVNCKCSLVTEVRREAKIGEYIKIVSASRIDHEGYETGDIILVKSVKERNGCILHTAYGINQRTKETTGKIVAREYVVLENYKPEEKPEFKPYLENERGTHYGNIGNITPLKDAIGRKLRVGDTVELYDEYNRLRGERVVVENEIRKFVYGIASNCQNNGEITRFKIILKRRYENIANGETVDRIKYIKEEV